MTNDLVLIFHAGRQLPKVRFIMVLSLICAVWGAVAGIDLAQTYGIRPADGGMLAPLGVRLAWGIGVAALGIGFAVGMDIYGRCYIARIHLVKETQCLQIETLRWWGRAVREIAASDILGSRHHSGYYNAPGAQTVHAPWQFIYTRGRRMPYILDLQGKIEDMGLARKYLKL